MNKMRTIVVALVWAGCAAHGQELDMHGTVYQPACAQPQWRAAHDHLLDIAGDRAPADLASLIRAYVCGTGVLAAQEVRRHAPKRLVQSTSGTGEESTSSLVDRSELVPHAGQAWGVSIERDGGDIFVSFFVNEACIHGVGLRFNGVGWLIVQKHDGCD